MCLLMLHYGDFSWPQQKNYTKKSQFLKAQDSNYIILADQQYKTYVEFKMTILLKNDLSKLLVIKIVAN